MKIILVALSIVIPLLMYYIHHKQPKINMLYHLIALIAVITFGNIAALSIYQIINEKTVFTMDIHGLFLNPLFLLSGAYIGVYLLYQLLVVCVNSVNR